MRFDAEQWMDWQATVFWPALRPLFTQLARTSPSVIARAEELSLAAVRMLDAQLSGRMYVAGDSFSSDLVSTTKSLCQNGCAKQSRDFIACQPSMTSLCLWRQLASQRVARRACHDKSRTIVGRQ
ncbi:hypothetical protein IVB14_17515 [Bradyrhizobium sp. 180]|uniref:hypothetical protein n=1 Tax=Bradyrhizobium sp. 180 TaxID=2782650 RepID=UPI001FF8E33F|nr:hypothetical protein [Bradyrhizobium sp. 180]MCK1492171.1 hypothetical protein [Bradyrhizobium sp. 180]